MGDSGYTYVGIACVPSELVAVISVEMIEGDSIKLQLRTMVDALPYDRPLVARLLRGLADQLDEISATMGSATPGS